MKPVFTTVLCLLFCALTLFASEQLPTNLTWITNDSDPVFASPLAQKGGSYTTWIKYFPLTFRDLGKDSTTPFRDYLDSNQLAPLTFHPNTLKPLPSLATHWAFGSDGKSLFFKLNEKAIWSDDKRVRPEDFIFALELLRSPFINDPLANEFYLNEFEKVVRYDETTIGVFGKVKRSPNELIHYLNLKPSPSHFYKLDKNWSANYNLKIAPTTGPYRISEIEKNKSITFERKKNWWGENLKYFAHRFNVDKVKFLIIAENKLAYDLFLKGEIDSFPLMNRETLEEKLKNPLYKNGYINASKFYTDHPRPDVGFFLNLDKKPLDDKNVRLALTHGLNFNLIINSIFKNSVERLPRLSVGSGEYENKKILSKNYDPQKVEEFLKKAGWGEKGSDGIRVKNSNRLSLEIIFSNDFYQRAFLLFKDEAKKLGIELNFKFLNQKDAQEAVLKKEHQIAFVSWRNSLIPQYKENWHSSYAHKEGTKNITNIASDKLDRAIAQFENASDDLTKVNSAHSIQQLIDEDVVFIPSFMVSSTKEAFWRYFKFPHPIGTKMSESIFDLFLGKNGEGGLFWLDEKEKQDTLKLLKENYKYPIGNIVDIGFKR